MATKPTKQTKLIGGAKSTGVFITKADMKQLIEVIAKANAKDNLIKKVDSVKVIGGRRLSGGVLMEPPSMGSLSIQDFVKKLAKAYDMPDEKFYGINKFGEFMEWVTPAEFSGGH